MRISQFEKLTKTCCFPFIYNLTAINDGGELDEVLHETYLSEPELKKENASTFETFFKIWISKYSNKKFMLSIYDKHDSFPCSII